MNKIIALLFVFFIGFLNMEAQKNLSETEKLETLCKVWGFLKFYHPNVAQGKFDWDNHLVNQIKESSKPETKEQFNKRLFDWIETLGTVEKCSTCDKKSKKDYFLKNFDLSWTDNHEIFSQNMIDKLNFIEANRNQQKSYYIDGNINIVKFKNEKDYADFPEKEMRLVELFRYWNYIEYFFPNKYLTDQNWNSVLVEMIPKVQNAKNLFEYRLALLQLVEKIDDSHGFYDFDEMNEYFGAYYPGISTKIIEDELVITKILKNYSGKYYDLKSGDVIKKIDGKTISEKFRELSPYVPASNLEGKWRNAFIQNLFLRTNNSEIELTIDRNGEPFTKTYPTLSFFELKSEKIDEMKQKWSFISPETAYVNLGILEKSDVDKMYAEVKNSKFLVLDLRNYPKGTAWPLSNKFLPQKTVVTKLIFPDFTYPGKFYFSEDSIGKNNKKDYYKGQIIILVNETTQSQAEYSTMFFQANKNAKVIGSRTAGADGNVVKLKLANIETWFSGLGVFYPDGKETQRIGIVPDIIVKPTIKGIKENKDEVLERALEFIRTGK